MTLDPIELQIVTGALRAACEEMGAALIRAAHSPNIKERRDASTALFDARGQMVMQAEHIPVHLGSMPAAVAAVLDREHFEGVSWVLNDPFAGGTHLPDITLVTPVFAPCAAAEDQTGGGKGRDRGDGERGLIGFAASRAHHADVGGRVPGSMPADSRTLAEEGVVISPRPATPEAIEEIVAAMRQPDERRADLRAQLAANHIGALRLSELAARVGLGRLREAFDAVLDYAERRTRACIAAFPDGTHTARDVLEAIEGDIHLCLRATVAGERLILDFTGSAPQHAGNLNCPLAVTLSACYFAVRVLTDPDIPPSAGAYRPLEVRVPEGSLLNALPTAPPRDSTGAIPPDAPCGRHAPRDRGGGTGSTAAAGPTASGPKSAPAVAAGNVETSSRVADLVLAAFGRALGQGTMNNLTLGDECFSYYETLGGGQGACPDADGPSGVHVAMSNTLNTPIEALERELPLRVTHYALRRGSGGVGAHHGGDGVVREIEALREVTFSLITDRRRHAPPGAEGGQPGASGRNLLLAEGGAAGHGPPGGWRNRPGADDELGRAGSTSPVRRGALSPIRYRELPGKITGVLHPGGRLRIETPGGGGHGTGEPGS
jgi:N-methylhydantoinase B